MGPTSDDPVDGAVLFGAGNVFTLSLPVIVGKEMFVGDGIYVDMSWRFDGGSDEVGFVAFGISGE